MACLDPEGVMDQELTFVQFLQDAQTFRFVDEQLQIFTSDSEALTFIPPE
jgi:heat shock protein HslJ